MPKKKYISIANCSICKNLENYEGGFQKYGWEEDDTFLPKETDEIEQAPQKFLGMLKHKGTLKVCPECNCYYAYDSGYDYLVNGSEDYQDLWRLTPTEVKFVYSQKAYKERIANLKADLKKKNQILQHYVVRSLVDYYVDEKDFDELYKTYKKLSAELKYVFLGRIWSLTSWENKHKLKGRKVEVKKFVKKIEKDVPKDAKNTMKYLKEDLGMGKKKK